MVHAIDEDNAIRIRLYYKQFRLKSREGARKSVYQTVFH